MKSRWYNYGDRRPRKAQGRKAPAAKVMQDVLVRPLVLPEGADPELGGLFGVEPSERSEASATARRPVRPKPSSAEAERPAFEGERK